MTYAYIRHIAGLATLACMLAVPAIHAAQIEDEIKRYDYEIDWKTMKAVQDMLTPRQYAEQTAQLGISFPVYPPKRRPEDVAALIRREVERVVEEEYPSAREDEISQEAQEKYRLYKVGDSVTISARIRSPEYADHSGILRMVTVEHLKLGDKLVSLEDVHPRDRAHFDRFVREEAIKSYISINKRRFREDRERFEAIQRADITKAIYQQNGYTQVKGKWWPTRLVFTKLYENQLAALMAEKRPEIRRHVLVDLNGIQLDESGNPVLPEGADEIAVDNRTNMQKATPVLRDIVSVLYGLKLDDGEGASKPLADEGAGLFDDVQPAPTAPEAANGGAPAQPAPLPDVSDLYDEDDE